MANDILIQPGTSTIHFSGSADSDIKLEVLASGSVQFTGESGSLLTISDSYSGSLFNVNDITGMPILDVNSNDTVTLGQFSSPIKVLTNSSGHTMVSGSSTSTGSFGKIEGSVTIPSGKALKTSLIRGGSPVTIDATSLRLGTGGMSDVYSNNLVITSNAPAIFLGDTDVTNLRHSIVGGGNAGLEISADIHNATTGYIGFAIGGSAVARMVEGGNVGIGTSTPQTQLHLVGAGEIMRIENDTNAAGNTFISFYDTSALKGHIGFTGGSTDHLNLYNNENADVRFFTNQNLRMTVAAGGNVGIGTTTPNANARLHIYKTGNNHLWIDSDGTADVGVFGRHNGTAIFGIFDDHSDSKLRIVNYQAEAIEFSTDRGDTENVAMTILDSGNVGIGTVTPDNKLEIRGGELKITDSQPEIIFERQSDGLRSYLVGDGTGRFNFSYHTRNSGEYVQIDTNASGGSFVRNIGSGYLTLGSNSHDQLSLLANGNVSITKDLVVAGSITAQEFITELNTVTIIESSGSTKFGNTLDDTHQITGSLTVTGSGNGVFKVLSRNGSVPVFQINNTTAQANSIGINTAPTNGVLDIRTTGQDRFIINLKNASGGNIGGFYTTGNRGIVQMRNSSGQAKVNLDSAGTSYLTGGSVGIGTTSPHANATLNVENTSGVAMIYITSAANNDTSLVFEEGATAKWMMGHDNSNSDAFTISDGNGFASGTKFTILSSGNVGIGETSPGYPLEVVGATGNTVAKFGETFALHMVHNAPVLGFNLYYNSGYKFGEGSSSSYGGYLALSPGDGKFTFATSNAGNAGGAATMTPRVTILNNGNVGIGTTSPDNTLHIASSGDLFMKYQANSTSNGIQFRLFHGSTHTATINSNTTNIFSIHDGAYGTEVFSIKDGGNIGINRTSPGYKFEVGGVILGTGGVYSHALILAGNSTDGAPSFAMANDPDTGWRSDLSNNMRFITGGTARMVLDSSGRLGIGETSPSERLEVAGGIAFSGTADMTGGTDLGKATIDTDGTDRMRFHINGANNAVYGGYEFRQSKGDHSDERLVMLIDETGNVGIGTNNPTYTLDVAGNIGVNGAILHNDDPDTYIQFSTNKIGFYTGNGGNFADFNITRNLISGSSSSTGSFGQIQTGVGGKILANTNNDARTHVIIADGNIGGPTYNATYINLTGGHNQSFANNDFRFYSAEASTNLLYLDGGTSRATFAGAIVVGSEVLNTNFSSSIAGRVATLDAASSGITISNNSNDRVLTGDGSNANAESALIFDGRNLGVGASPSKELDVQNTGLTEARVKATSSGRARLHLDGYSDIAEIYFALNGANKGAIYQNSAGTNLNVYSFANNTAIMTFDYANDRVGIGATQPDSLLHISAGSGNDAIISIGDGSTDRSQIIQRNDGDFEIRNNVSTGNTEIHGGSARHVVIYAGNAQRAIFNASGNVGIGTSTVPEALTIGTISGGKNIAVSIYSYFGTTPGGLYTITGFNAKAHASTTNRVDVANTHGSSGYAYTLHRGYTNGITFHTAAGSTTAGTNITNTNERMRIDSIGNVGIGVIPEATSTSHTALQIGGNAIISSYKTQGTSGEVDFGHNFYYAQSGLDKYISTDEATKFRLTSGHFRFFTAPSGTAGNTVTFTERFTILQGGNVGIGSTNPGYKLDVNGTLGVHGNATFNNVNLSLYSNSYGSTGLLRIFGTDAVEKLQIGTLNSTTAFLYSPANVGQIIYAGGSQNIWHLASGNVGIGASPSFKLDVSGTTRVTGVARFDSTLTFNGNQSIETVGQSDSLYINPNANLHLGTAATDHTYIGASGRNVTINATTTAIAGQLNASGNLVVTGTSTFNIDGDSQFKIEDAGTNAVMLRTGASDELYFGSNNTWQLRFLANGSAIEVQNGIDFNPNTDSSSALGTTSQRWSNLFTDAATVGGTLTAGVFKASGDLDLYSGGNKLIGATNTNIGLLRNTSVSGDLSVTGNITAQQFITEYLTETVIATSGSTKWGNTADDIHQFTGSLKLKGTADFGSGGELKTSKITGTSPLSINAGTDLVSVTGSLEVTQNMRFNGAVRKLYTYHLNDANYIDAKNFQANTSSDINFQNAVGPANIVSVGNVVRLKSKGTTPLVASGSNVGIGTSTPTAILHISGANATHLLKIGTPQTSEALFFYNGSSIDNGYLGLKNTSGQITNYLHTKGSAVLGDATNENVGVGGLNAGNSNFKLQIKEKSDANAAIRFVDTDDMVWGWVGPARGTNQIVTGTTNGDFVIGNAYTVDTHIVTNSNIRMTIDQNGNVGINDTTPGYKLDVNGDGRFTGALSGNAGLTITGAHSTFTGTIYAEQGATSTLNGHGANLGGVLDLSLGSQASNRGTRILLNSGHQHGEFVIQARQSTTYSTGNIGIYRRSGVTTFSELLHIGGNGKIGINMGGQSPEQNFDVIGNIVHRTYSQIKSRKTTLREDGTINSSGPARYYRLRIPMTDGTEHTSGGMVNIRVIWHARHASRSTVQEYEFVYTTDHTRTSNNESFGIIDYRRTKHILGKRSYASYEYTAFPNVTIGLITTNGIGGVQLKVEGYRDSTNTQITVIAEVDGNSNAIPTLTDMGTSAESTSAINFYDQAGGSGQGVPGIVISGSIGSVNQRNHVGIMSPDGVTKPQSRLHIESHGAGNTYGSCLYLHGDTATNYPAMRIDNATGGNANETHGLIINNTAAGAGLRVNDGTSTAAFIVDGSGKVGIGTDGPTQMLHVHAGDILMTGGPSNLSPIAAVRWTYSTESGFGTSGKIDVIRNDADQGKGGDMRFFTQADNSSNGGTERFRIDQAGQLIIRANNKYLFGLTTGNATVALIGMDTGNYVRLAAAGYGVRTANGNFSLDGADNMTVNANAYFGEYLFHSGDTDTYMHFLDDRLILFAGGDNILDYEEDAASTLKLAGGGEADVTIGDANTFFIGGSQGSYDSKVGIGTNAPTEALTIRGTSTGTGGFAYPSIAGYTLNTKLWALEQHFGYEGRLGLYESGNLKVLIRANGESYINNGNDFGIGTASPSYKLHVAGTAFAHNLTLSGWSTGDGLTLNYGNSTGTVEAVTFRANGGVNGNIKMVMASANSGDMHFNASNRTNQLVMYRDGNVGVGTNIPRDNFHVQGNYKFDQGFHEHIFKDVGIDGQDYKHRYLLLFRVPNYGDQSVAVGFSGRFKATRVNELGVTIDSQIHITLGYGNAIRFSIEHFGGTKPYLVQYTHNSVDYLALYWYDAPGQEEGHLIGSKFTRSVVANWPDDNFGTVIHLANSSYPSGNHSAAPSYTSMTKSWVGGNVGINKTNPTNTLHVAGGITMEASNAILAMNVTNTTGACQIRFGDTGDSDIGKIVYGHNTNAMSFNTADTERLRIDSSGNVGIGTQTVDTLLHMFGDDETFFIEQDPLQAGGGRLYISAAGGADNANSAKVQLHNAGVIWGRTDGSGIRIGNTALNQVWLRVGNTYSEFNGYVDVETVVRTGDGSASAPAHTFNNDLDTGLFRADSNMIGFACGGSEKIRLDSTGRLGIGVTGHSAQLEVKRAGSNVARFYNSNGDTAGTQMWIGATKPLESSHQLIGGITSRFTSTAWTSATIEFKGPQSTGYGDGINYLTFNHDGSNQRSVFTGRVGINHANPTDPLHIYGGSGSTINFDTNSTSNWRVGATTSGGGYSTGDAFAWYCFDNTSYKMTLTTAGRLGIGVLSPSHTLHIDGDQRIHNGSLGIDVTPSTTDGVLRAGNDVIAYYSSDERLKENVKQIENPIEKVKQLRGVEFDWIVDEEIHPNKGHDIGVIAQDVEKVLPEIVETRKSGYKAVKYEKMVSLLIESVKEQQKQIEELKSEIQELKDGSSK